MKAFAIPAVFVAFFLPLWAYPISALPVLGPNDGSIQIEELTKKAPPAFDRQLKDYPSARFRDVTGHYVDYAGDRYFYLCGYVNSKNGFGGYRGWTRFLFSETRTAQHTPDLAFENNLADADLVTQMCDDGSAGRALKDYSALLVYRLRH